ncbi:hypothetical protein BDF14DRAFT_1880504 [Spinellus fusiger]|nr:hypothetical protein BDF14DRAFT_1880504 [Spinellus fusiger]
MNFQRASAILRSTRQNAYRLRRSVDSQEANLKQRSGPGFTAIATTAVGVGGAYVVYTTYSIKQAKNDIEDSTLKESKKNVSGGGGSEIA